MKTQHYRTLWLSDIHLGSRDCKAEFLLHFLEHVTVDTLYLVGDIIDMWEMSKQFRWPQSHNRVLHTLMQMSRDGTKVIYLPGNHDAPLQSYCGMQFGDIDICREAVHITATGKKYLVLHGDQFDADVTLGRLNAWIGDKAYDLLLLLNRCCNTIRQWQNTHYWSLAGYIKRHIKGANAAIARYRQACCKRAAKMKLDGVICGHIHHPEITIENGIHYINDGDWIENCSALAEDTSGNLALISWADQLKHTADITELKSRVKASDAA